RLSCSSYQSSRLRESKVRWKEALSRCPVEYRCTTMAESSVSRYSTGITISLSRFPISCWKIWWMAAMLQRLSKKPAHEQDQDEFVRTKSVNITARARVCASFWPD